MSAYGNGEVATVEGVPDTGEWGEVRSKIVEWHDPAGPARKARELDGLTYLRSILDGSVPAPPIAGLMNLRFLGAEPGRVVFALDPDESQYNPIGAIHGGAVCTLLDSVAGCAVHTTLPAGWGYTSVEIKVNYIRGAAKDSGALTATGVVKKAGRRIAFAEGEVTDAQGRLVATATSTLLVFEVPPRS